MASWSPSQSEPLTVSYMCHLQSSSCMLPSAALIPPWAATVCDRVGKSFEMQAVLKPASARPKAARRPAPPAPTTMASYSWSCKRQRARSIGCCGRGQKGWKRGGTHTMTAYLLLRCGEASLARSGWFAMIRAIYTSASSYTDCRRRRRRR